MNNGRIISIEEVFFFYFYFFFFFFFFFLCWRCRRRYRSVRFACSSRSSFQIGNFRTLIVRIIFFLPHANVFFLRRCEESMAYTNAKMPKNDGIWKFFNRIRDHIRLDILMKYKFGGEAFTIQTHNAYYGDDDIFAMHIHQFFCSCKSFTLILLFINLKKVNTYTHTTHSYQM